MKSHAAALRLLHDCLAEKHRLDFCSRAISLREPVVSGKHIPPCRRHNRPEEVLPFAGLYFRTIAGFACIRNN